MKEKIHPQYYDELGGMMIMPIIWPINIAREDIEFMWNYDTLQIWENMPFDYISLVENGFYEFELKNTTGIDLVQMKVDKNYFKIKINSQEDVENILNYFQSK